VVGLPCCAFPASISGPMAAAEEKAEKGAGNEEAQDDELDGQDIFYVCRKTLETLKEKLKKNEEVTQETVNELTFPEDLAADEIMVPVDMRGIGEDYDDVEQMVEKLGPKGTAEAFIKAAEYFEANKDKEPEDERPKPMTAAEWRRVLDDDDGEDGEEEDMFEDLESEVAEDDAEEGAGEPAAKKQKTDENPT